jgi:hypothetical protein
MSIPNINSEEDLSFYQEEFHQKLNHYALLLDSVITRILGESYKVENLPGDVLREMISITDELIYATNDELRRLKPGEYR